MIGMNEAATAISMYRSDAPISVPGWLNKVRHAADSTSPTPNGGPTIG